MPIFGWDRCVHPCDKIEAFLEQVRAYTVYGIRDRLVEIRLLRCLAGFANRLINQIMKKKQ